MQCLIQQLAASAGPVFMLKLWLLILQGVYKALPQAFSTHQRWSPCQSRQEWEKRAKERTMQEVQARKQSDEEEIGTGGHVRKSCLLVSPECS